MPSIDVGWLSMKKPTLGPKSVSLPTTALVKPAAEGLDVGLARGVPELVLGNEQAVGRNHRLYERAKVNLPLVLSPSAADTSVTSETIVTSSALEVLNVLAGLDESELAAYHRLSICQRISLN